jgi:hypothetical protein
MHDRRMTKYSTDRFLADCGATGPVRLVVQREGDPAETAYIFQQPSVLIGSHERANLRLVHPEVSARQLYLQVLGGRLFAMPISPRTETRWAGAARQSGWVEPDEPVTFGPYSVRLAGPVGAADRPQPQDPLRSAPGGGPTVTLELLRGDAPPTYGVLDRDLSLVGTTGLCRVRLRDPRISTVHCSLVRTPKGFWVVDLCGRGGVRVNGVVVHVALLEEGDLLDLEGQGIRILYDQVHSGAVALRATPADRAEQPTARTLLGYPADAVPVEQATGPLLDRFAEFQLQTFDRFEKLLQTMAQVFVTMLNEQRGFVRDELARMERLAAGAGGQPGLMPAASNGTPATATANEMTPESGPATDASPAAGNSDQTTVEGAGPPAATTPPPPSDRIAESQVNLWVEAQLDALRGERASMWRLLFGSRSQPPGESPPAGK